MIKNKKGFTLTELLVAIAIIGIMSAAALAYFSNNLRADQKLKLSADEMVAALREAQNNALSGKNMGNTDELPCSYTFSRVNDSSYKIVFNYHSSSTQCSSPSSRDLAVYQLKNGVKANANFSINFDVPHGTNFIPGSIILTKDSQSYYVCLNASGDIYSCKDSSCDKNKC